MASILGFIRLEGVKKGVFRKSFGSHKGWYNIERDEDFSMKYKEFIEEFGVGGHWAKRGLDKPETISLTYIDTKELIEELTSLFPALKLDEMAFAIGDAFVKMNGIDIYMEPRDDDFGDDDDPDWEQENWEF